MNFWILFSFVGMKHCNKTYLFNQVFKDRWAATGAFSESITRVKKMSVLQARTTRTPRAFPHCCCTHLLTCARSWGGAVSTGWLFPPLGRRRGTAWMPPRPIYISDWGQALTSIEVKLLVRGDRLTEVLLHAEQGKGYFIKRNQWARINSEPVASQGRLRVHGVVLLLICARPAPFSEGGQAAAGLSWDVRQHGLSREAGPLRSTHGWRGKQPPESL